MCKTILLCLWIFGTRLSAAHLSLTDLNDPQSIRLFSQLVSEQWASPAEEVQATADAMSSLLIYLAPNIKKIPGYAGLFAGNCSVFFNNKTIEQVGCNIIPVSLVSANAADQIKEATPLPAQYATQITQSNILLASLFADWSRRIAQKVERFQVDLFLKVETCTRTMSQTETQSQSETSLSETLSKTAINSSTLTELLSKTASVSKSISPSISSTQVESLSQTTSTSQSSSKTLSDVATSTMTRMSGLLAAWNSSSGAYEDGTGQLGRYNASNGVVTDTFTSLQWQQASSSTTMSWDDAVLYCSNRTTGGFNDWRLPNNAELQSLLDYTIPYRGPVPGISEVFNNTPTSYFWSSIPFVGSPGQVWYVSYGQTAQYSGLVCNKGPAGNCRLVPVNGYTRCVRSLYQPLPTERYITTSGTATDAITGLIWQRVSTGGAMTQANAITHCSGLSLPSFSSGWRLPTVKELATLVDYSVTWNSLMMDTTVFAGEPADWFWTSTLLTGNLPYVWSVRFNYGDVAYYNVSLGNYVRCVACSVPATTGLLAAWSKTGGTYDDATNQTGRYNVSNGIVLDTLTGIQWQQNASVAAMKWTDAAAYCANQTTGGLNGWRVPNIGELGTLVDYTSSASPFLNTTAFPGPPASSLWSSTSDAGNAGNSWYLYFSSYGQSTYTATTAAYTLRCVRSCYPTPPSRYTVTSGEATDSMIGLIWQQVSTGSTMTWANAITHCSGLPLNGRTWRLPTARELTTLVDYSISQGGLMMNTAVFVGEPVNVFWTSTAMAGYPFVAWSVAFGDGSIGGNNIANGYYVRCVR